MEMLSRSCPLCGATDTSRIFAEADFDFDRLDGFAFASRKMPEYMHYRLIECTQCDLLYATPLPREEFLVAGYSEAAYDSSEEAHNAASNYASFLPGIKERLADLQGAMDIGAGDGAFLEFLIEHGFEGIVGIEPSLAPIAAARNDIAPLIRTGIFRTEDFAPETFSLITCFQTLEHLYNPLEMIRGVWRLLKPGGAAFFICHNRRSLSARLLGTKSPIFDIEHLQLFSPESARYLLEQNGFSSVTVCPVVNRYPLRYWLRLAPLPQNLKLALITAFDRIGAGGLQLSIPAGNIAVIGFKPKLSDN
jgi:SAM-dependent methyltransferase